RPLPRTRCKHSQPSASARYAPEVSFATLPTFARIRAIAGLLAPGPPDSGRTESAPGSHRKRVPACATAQTANASAIEEVWQRCPAIQIAAEFPKTAAHGIRPE